MNARHISSRSNPRRRSQERRQALRLEPVDHRRAIPRGERELRFRGVGDAGHRRRRLALRDVAHRREPRGPGREQVAEDLAPGRQPVHVHGRGADDAEAALAAEDHLAHARAGRGARHRADDEHPARRGDAQTAGQLGDVAVLVGLHARRARGDPAAERRVRERVGEVAHRPAGRVELLLQARAVDARLHLGQPRRRVDRQHPVEPAHVDRDHRPRFALRRLQAARDVRARAERDHHGVGVQRRPQHLRQLLLAPGTHHEVG